jgi:lysophospholipase L1-like esterase
MRVRRLVLAALVVLCTALPAQAQSKRDENWVATWAPSMMARPLPGAGRGQGPGPVAPNAPVGGAAAPAAAAQQPVTAGAPPAGGVAAAGAPGGRGPAAPPLTFNNQTIRQIAHLSLGGSRFRVVFTNAFGNRPLRIGAADVALRECADGRSGCTRSSDTAIMGTPTPLTVNGKAEFLIPAGALVVSDPIALTVAALSDVVIDTYLPDDWSANTSPLTFHQSGSQMSYISGAGNVAGASSIQATATPTSWFFVSSVQVVAPANTRVIAPFGDSITDGARSTANTNARWPDVLARRLVAERRGGPVAVINAGIGGNRLLSEGTGVNALARFDRDVLMMPGVTHVIIMEGINDIGGARGNPVPSGPDLIDAYRQLIIRARTQGIKVIGATLTPFDGAAYYSVEGEAKRVALNEWIRTTKDLDGVIDFDKITRDPAKPSQYLPLYDAGDHLHPSDAGYAAMGNAIDLALFR